MTSIEIEYCPFIADVAIKIAIFHSYVGVPKSMYVNLEEGNGYVNILKHIVNPLSPIFKDDHPLRMAMNQNPGAQLFIPLNIGPSVKNKPSYPRWSHQKSPYFVGYVYIYIHIHIMYIYIIIYIYIYIYIHY